MCRKLSLGRLQVVGAVEHVGIEIDLDDVACPRVAQTHLGGPFAFDQHRVRALEPVADVAERGVRHVVGAEDAARLCQVFGNLAFVVEAHSITLLKRSWQGPL